MEIGAVTGALVTPPVSEVRAEAVTTASRTLLFAAKMPRRIEDLSSVYCRLETSAKCAIKTKQNAINVVQTPARNVTAGEGVTDVTPAIAPLQLHAIGPIETVGARTVDTNVPQYNSTMVRSHETSLGSMPQSLIKVPDNYIHILHRFWDTIRYDTIQ